MNSAPKDYIYDTLFDICLLWAPNPKSDDITNVRREKPKKCRHGRELFVLIPIEAV